jgi:FemAB-related protein (PEP-CTERM system-associated)
MNAAFAASNARESGQGAGATLVRALSDADREAWDRFVIAAPDATFFHLSAWRHVIERVCGHRTHYLYTTRNGEITGVLPLAEIKSRWFGHSLISTPFCVYGGAVAVSDPDRTVLEQRARTLADELRVDYLELRNVRASAGDWGGKDLYVTFRKPIAADDDTNLKSVPRKQRAMIRKGIDAGLTSEINRDIGRFYDMYAISVRNLGTPVLGKRFFVALLEEFRDAVDVLTISHDGKPVSSVLSFYFRDEVLPYYGGGTADARDLKANDFMYWELMRHAVKRGATLFDFGRSKVGTGSYSFKTHWGFEPRKLEYQYHLVRSPSVPDLSPMNPKYRALIATWKRLPVALTRVLGPVVARYLG